MSSGRLATRGCQATGVSQGPGSALTWGMPWNKKRRGEELRTRRLRRGNGGRGGGTPKEEEGGQRAGQSRRRVTSWELREGWEGKVTSQPCQSLREVQGDEQ